jgi:DNA-binding NarL/FixJ family response regulator
MNLLVIDDHPITRVGVRQLVQNRWPDAHIAEVPLAADAALRLGRENFDAIVLDLNLPDVQGLEGLIRLRRVAPQTPMLVLSAHAERAYAARSLQEGAQGYLNKDRAPDELVAALDRIVTGGRYITESLADELAEQLLSGTQRNNGERALHEELSSQEYRVMLQLADGLGISEIAERMHLSPKTVSTYRSRILEKLHMKSNAELVKYCVAHQLTG